jgi:hypothetical protein
MTVFDFKEYLDHRHFRPFRIFVSDGTVFDIRHPEMANVGPASVRISPHTQGTPEVLPEKTVLVSMFHIVKLEYL